MDVGIWDAMGAFKDTVGNVRRVPLGAVVDDGKLFMFLTPDSGGLLFRKARLSSRYPCNQGSG